MIREIPDFPRPGVNFKDITTLLKDGRAFRQAVDELAGLLKGCEADIVVGPEARGFVMGAVLAYALGKGFVPVRKAGKLPAEVLRGSYELEYGTDVLEIHKDAITPGQKVLVVDDLLATGGTVHASIALVEQLGGVVEKVAFLIELSFLPGREKLKGYDVVSVITY